MLMYFNGDSFTEGAGLSDQSFFPETYPGNYDTMEEVMKAKWRDTLGKIIDNETDNALRTKLRLANIERAYPKHIEKLIGGKVINAGVGGSSMKSIMLRTLFDLEQLSAAKQIPTHVFIGLTYKERVTIPNVSLEVDSGSLSHSIIPGFENPGLSAFYTKYAKQFWRSHTDEQMLVHHLQDIITIKFYVEKKFNITPIFLETYVFAKKDAVDCENTKSPLLKMLWETADIKYITERKSLFDFKTKFVADGHLTEDAHINFASYIVDTYLK
jgi:hypothetical protein